MKPLALPTTVAVVLAAALIAVAPGCARSEDPSVVGPPASRAEVEPAAPPAGDTPDLDALEIGLRLVADGFEQPLLVTGAGDGSGRLFVAEKAGRLSALYPPSVKPKPFLDLSDAVSTESERGLLGVAFPERFAEHGYFYVSYTDRNGSSVISRFLTDGERAHRDSEQVLLSVEQPYANHNGGNIVFGPDGHLYTSLGDGGSAGDPQSNGQDLSTLLGAMLRIDVGESADSPEPTTADSQPDYSIPADNPFVGQSGVRPEIWSYGLRNPWRFSFDRETGGLWIADVGQNEVEEVNFQPAGSPGGENWGWNLFEGTAPYPPDREVTEDLDDFAWPIVEYEHPIGRSVTGGFVYRGEEFPAMRGVYLYGDYVTGRIWGLVRDPDGSAENRELLESESAVVSFGEGDDGELYLVDFGGAVYRVEAR